MGELKDSWDRLVACRGEDVGLVLAEVGECFTFGELDRAAEALLARHPALGESSGRIWAFAVPSPVEWLGIYLAALKVGAVAMPVEAVGAGGVDRAQLLELGVAYCLTGEGLDALADGPARHDGHLMKLTSGTTGRAKALLFTERAMAADGWQIMRSMGITGEDCNYALIPLGHSYGLGNLLMPLILEGTRLVIGSAPYPQVVAGEIRRYGCTVLPAVPPLIKALARAELTADALTGLKLVISAGSVLAPDVAARFYENSGLRVHNFYGSSETGGICFDRTGAYTLSGESVGEPLDGVTVLVAADGAIYVKSAAVCRQVLTARGCLMNDFGELGPRGELKLIGRDSDFIKLAGRRLFLSEIELVLCRLAGVEDAYVSHRPGRSGESRLIALVQSEQSAATIKAALRAHLPDWKVPKRIVTVAAIPHTRRGKKDRRVLEAMIDAARQP